MPRRDKPVTITYVDVVLSDGVIWRIDPVHQRVYELEHMPGDAVPITRGPVTVAQFITMLRERREELA